MELSSFRTGGDVWRIRHRHHLGVGFREYSDARLFTADVLPIRHRHPHGGSAAHERPLLLGSDREQHAVIPDAGRADDAGRSCRVLRRTDTPQEECHAPLCAGGHPQCCDGAGADTDRW